MGGHDDRFADKRVHAAVDDVEPAAPERGPSAAAGGSAGGGRSMASDRASAVPSSTEVLRTTVTRLRDENDHLQRALRHRSVIEQAKGVLMARLGVGPDTAFAYIREQSRNTNQRVTRVAAAVVAAAATSASPSARPRTGTLPQDLVPRQWTPAAELEADMVLAGVAVQQARDLDDLARTVVEETAEPFGVAAALLGALEPDGSVRLVAGHGYPARMMSAWQRMPGDLDVPLLAAVRTRRPRFFATREELTTAFPAAAAIPSDHVAQASLPLVCGDQVVGVLGVSWADEAHIDDAVRAGLASVAASAAGTFAALLHRDGDVLSELTIDVAGTRWFRAVLDAIPSPVTVLEPVRDGQDPPADFRYEYCNPATVDVLGRGGDELVGRTLAELYPDLVGSALLDDIRRGYAEARTVRSPGAPVKQRDASGTGHEGWFDVALTRIGDSLLLSWVPRQAD